MNYLISFGDNNNFKYKKLMLRKESEQTNWFDEVIIHSPETLVDFFDKHKDFVANSRGYGYWIWKPYIILDLLEKINEGDNIFYIDCGGSIVGHKNKRFEEYLQILNNTPIIVFGDGGSFENPPDYKEKYFQKMRVLKRFNLENDENFLNSGQVEGGVFICKKCQESVDFVKEWLDLLTEDNYSLVNDEDIFEQSSDFMGHRHDQSILSILSKKKNVNILGLNECYGMGPFFSGRVSDRGSRERAPDRFRREKDYDNNKHYTWAIYLHDTNVKENIIKEIKKIFSLVKEEMVFYDIDYDLNNEFLKKVLKKVNNLQFRKGFLKTYLKIIEFPENTILSKEKIIGLFSCQFTMGDEYRFNFYITPNSISFPEEIDYNEFQGNSISNCEYTREYNLYV